MTTDSTFIDHLRRSLDGDRKRGERAALRRYWSPATRSQAYPILGQLGALDDSRKAILAALYVEHPAHQSGMTIGKAAAKLGERKKGKHPYDLHFRRLLSCQEIGHTHTPADLAIHLHRLVKRLAREGIGLDYAALHKNLNFWKNYRDKVLLGWASDFWGAPVPATQAITEP